MAKPVAVLHQSQGRYQSVSGKVMSNVHNVHCRVTIGKCLILIITKTWRGKEGHGDTDVAGYLVTSQNHPGHIKEPHLEKET